MSDFLGVTRERLYSPGRVDDDAAVLQAVARSLRASGHEVTVIDSDSGDWPRLREDAVVFAMCQGSRALAKLASWEAAGIRVINRSEGILNCQRHRTIPLLNRANVGLPESLIVDTAAGAFAPAWVAESGTWIKRGDVHATESDDVVHVADAAAAVAALDRFRARGIATAVVQRHIPGVVLKFYAVRGSFFHCVRTPGAPQIPATVLRRIDEIGQAAAAQLGVEIYGGDCVYGKEDALALIDLNDWPSYSSCRASAAVAIADYVQAQKESQP